MISAQAKSSPKLIVIWTLGAILVISAVVAAAANLTHDRLFHPRSLPGNESVKADPAAVGDPKANHDKTTTVVLPDGKFQLARIQVESVQAIDMPKEVVVTGRIEADPNRRVEIHARAPGVVRSVPVQPGSKVKKGDVLVVLDSPEVGSARLLVRERQRALATARVEATWKSEVAVNAKAMIGELRKGVEAQKLAKPFADKILGNARGTLISAFVDLEIAAHEQEKQTELKAAGINGEHLLFVAQHTREGAQAKFEAALEVVSFQVSQEDRVARQMVRNAEEMVVDAAQRLRLLGVAEDINELLNFPERASALPSGSEDLTSYPIVAPFDGSIVSTTNVMSQRVDMTDPLFVLADLAKVYAVASIDESNFGVLPSLPGSKIRFTAKAYPGRQFLSRMLYNGAEVDPITRIVRMVSETDNPDGLLVLGMFINIVLDTASIEKALTVPLGSVVEVEGKSAVFVPGNGERTFVIRPVKLGREALGRQIVTEGLKPGDRVVITGAFLVKSELILQNESGEE